MRPTGKTQYLGSYLNRLISRAVNNPNFENNTKGSYRIEPQHGVNIYKFNIYKSGDHLASFSIGAGIYADISRANKREQGEIQKTLLTLYRGKPMIFKEI